MTQLNCTLSFSFFCQRNKGQFLNLSIIVRSVKTSLDHSVVFLSLFMYFCKSLSMSFYLSLSLFVSRHRSTFYCVWRDCNRWVPTSRHLEVSLMCPLFLQRIPRQNLCKIATLVWTTTNIQNILNHCCAVSGSLGRKVAGLNRSPGERAAAGVGGDLGLVGHSVQDARYLEILLKSELFF